MSEWRPKNCVKDTKLNEELVLTMRARAKAGEPVVKIAIELGIGYETARKAISGASWGWVGGAKAANWKEEELRMETWAKQKAAAFEAKFLEEQKKKEEEKPEVESEFVNPKETHGYY